MLEITGKCCGSLEAIEFMESLADVIPEEMRDEEFCEEYEATLNRFRYEAAKSVGKKPKVIKAKYERYGTFYNCGKCGASIDINDNYCGNCGMAILWDNTRCLTK